MNDQIKHVVFFSGGLCSWAEAKETVKRHGRESVLLLFADTKIEDDDLYRFLDESAKSLGCSFIKIADGRTPWEVMKDNKCLASTRMDTCSKVLKRELLDRWVKNNLPADCVLHFGLDWTEVDRFERLQRIKAPRVVESYVLKMQPIVTREKMIEWLKNDGIAAPKLYALGFPHNNCGGFCVKAGQAHFALLYRTMPERFKFHEEQEAMLRESIGWRQTILRDRTGGTTKPLSLADFRKRLEQERSFDEFEWGGCGCAVD